MAKIAVRLNDVPVEKSPATLELWKAVMSTQNPGSDTIVKAVKEACDNCKDKKGNKVDYITAVFLAAGKPDEKISLFLDDKLAATFTRSQMARKMQIALDVKSWQGEIITEKTGERKSADKGELEG